jgi:hypothetical protein
MGSEWILGRMAAGVEWILLAPDRVQWRALENTWWTFGFCAMDLFITNVDYYFRLCAFKTYSPNC